MSIFDSGIIVIQGKDEILDAFENRFDTIKQNVNRRRKEQVRKTLEQLKVKEPDSETEDQDKQKLSFLLFN